MGKKSPPTGVKSNFYADRPVQLDAMKPLISSNVGDPLPHCNAFLFRASKALSGREAECPTAELAMAASHLPRDQSLAPRDEEMLARPQSSASIALSALSPDQPNRSVAIFDLIATSKPLPVSVTLRFIA